MQFTYFLHTKISNSLKKDATPLPSKDPLENNALAVNLYGTGTILYSLPVVSGLLRPFQLSFEPTSIPIRRFTPLHLIFISKPFIIFRWLSVFVYDFVFASFVINDATGITRRRRDERELSFAEMRLKRRH